MMWVMGIDGIAGGSPADSLVPRNPELGPLPETLNRNERTCGRVK